MRFPATGIDALSRRDIMNQIMIPQSRPPGIASRAFLVSGVVYGETEIFLKRILKGLFESVHTAGLLFGKSIPYNATSVHVNDEKEN